MIVGRALNEMRCDKLSLGRRVKGESIWLITELNFIDGINLMLQKKNNSMVMIVDDEEDEITMKTPPNTLKIRSTNNSR